MNKWRIGISVLALFVFIMFVFVIYQGINSRQDRQTSKKAQAIASKLNNYVNGHQKIPVSLSEVGVTDVPSTIDYTKTSDSTYKFCVNYKNNSTNLSQQAQDELTKAAFGGFGASNSYSTDSGSSSSYENTYLYLSPTYKKGENCQTIKPYLYSSSYQYDYGSGSSGSSSSSSSGGSSTYDSSTPYCYFVEPNNFKNNTTKCANKATCLKTPACKQTYGSSLSGSSSSSSSSVITQ